jgi:hypothetical protein
MAAILLMLVGLARHKDVLLIPHMIIQVLRESKLIGKKTKIIENK